MKCRNGETNFRAGDATLTGRPACGIQGLYDGVEKPDAIVAPPCRVKGDRQFPIAVFVYIRNSVDEFRHPRTIPNPILGGLLDRSTNSVSAMTQQSEEQTVAALEVIRDTGVGHADSVRDGPYLDRTHSAFDKHRLSRTEDQRLRFVGATSYSRLTHTATLP